MTLDTSLPANLTPSNGSPHQGPSQTEIPVNTDAAAPTFSAPGIQGRFAVERGGFALNAAFTLPGAGVSGLFGPSGAGKTTLLRCLAGLERAPQGFLRVGDALWQDESRGVFVPPHRRRVGVVFQEARLFTHLSVARNLRYGLHRVPAGLAGRPTEGLDFDRVVNMLSLRGLLGQNAGQLSGGEQKRVALGRALLSAPRLLLMDEPLAGLDLESRLEILPFLERLHRELNLAVVLVSHELDEILRLADHLVLLQQGRVLAQGPLLELLARLDLPLAWREDALTIWEGPVTHHDPAYQLTTLSTPAGPLVLTGIHGQVGAPLRAFIQARDVSLALEAPTASSILNILPLTVASLQQGPSGAASGGPSPLGGQILVRLEAQGMVLLSRISAKSQDHLKLQPGQRVFAQIKSVAMQGITPGI